MLKEEVKSLYLRVKELEKDKKKDLSKMPSNCYFLDKDTILCKPREIGDGRFPYQVDGLTIWAYSSGNIAVHESLFNVFLDSTEGKEPYLAAFFGEETVDGFNPVSITGVARRGGETGVNRWVVYTPCCAYYFAETKNILSVFRCFIDEKKRLCFSTYIENLSNKEVKTYLSNYYNPLLRNQLYDDFEDKWYRSVEKTADGFKLKVTEYINRDNCMIHYAYAKTEGVTKTTTSRVVYTGATANSLSVATPLYTGKFGRVKNFTEFTEIAAMGDITPITLKAGGKKETHYLFAVSDDEKTCRKLTDVKVSETIEKELSKLVAKNEKAPIKKMEIEFNGFTGEFKGKDKVVNDFLYNATRQVDFCAKAKNYADAYIGVRDVTQQVEATIPWDFAYTRKKLIEILSFIGDDGRAPRQYSYPQKEGVAPKMDLRAYIDQGVWVVSCAYTYLCYTGDYSILDEKCGYYNFDGLTMTLRTGTTVNMSKRYDTVLEHLISICDFLISNVDEKTNCLHALYGDWNDALDGLGKTDKKDKIFGTGVSVMATLQLYRNLGEMAEILTKTKKFNSKAKLYLKKREEIKNGLIKYAIVEKGSDKKIVHGWGDDRSYFVGSFCDNDKKCRDSVIVNSFWILSGLYKEYGEIIPYILKAYERLEGKYGLKTFNPYFAPDNDKVGRITHLPEGTAENGATYNHSTLFAVMSLLEIGECEKAWKQLFKVIPVNHKIITTTPFVMSNSFIYNEEKGFDGESMNDWFTGSATVLIKSIIGGVFGVKPNLDGLEISLSKYLPCTSAKMNSYVKDAKIEISYLKKGGKERRYFVNGKEISVKDNKVEFTNSELKGKIKLEIVD